MSQRLANTIVGAFFWWDFRVHRQLISRRVAASERHAPSLLRLSRVCAEASTK